MAIGKPWNPQFTHFYVVSRWPSPPLKAGRENPVDAEVKISFNNFLVPAGTQLTVTATTIGHSPIVVALTLLKDVTYVPVPTPANPGSVRIRWTFIPPVSGKYTFTYRDNAGIVRGIDFPTVQP